MGNRKAGSGLKEKIRGRSWTQEPETSGKEWNIKALGSLSEGRNSKGKWE